MEADPKTRYIPVSLVPEDLLAPFYEFATKGTFEDSHGITYTAGQLCRPFEEASVQKLTIAIVNRSPYMLTEQPKKTTQKTGLSSGQMTLQPARRTFRNRNTKITHLGWDNIGVIPRATVQNGVRFASLSLYEITPFTPGQIQTMLAGALVFTNPDLEDEVCLAFNSLNNGDHKSGLAVTANLKSYTSTDSFMEAYVPSLVNHKQKGGTVLYTDKSTGRELRIHASLRQDYLFGDKLVGDNRTLTMVIDSVPVQV